MKFKILSLFTALAMAFSCAFGMSACSQPVTVKSVEINADGDLIITMTDGSKSNIGKVQGNNGVDGAGVANAYIDGDGNLIIELTTGEKLNCGEVASPASKDFYYCEVKENGEVTGYTVTGLADSSVTSVVIPATLNGKPVAGIEAEAFSGSEGIVSVTIPDSVKTIGERAFADCANLKNVSFGSGIVEIGRNAFARCGALINVNISDIGAWCGISFATPASNPLYFAHNLYLDNVLLTELTVPDTVTEISGYAFYECNNLTSVNTGSGVKSIGEGAFFNCSALESVTIGSAETIGEEAFSDCTALKTLNFGGKLKSIGGFAFNRCSALTELTIPSSVEEIGENSFAECTALRNLTLNFGLKTIGRGAFCGCSSLEKFIMPDSVAFIDFGMLMNTEGGFVDGSAGMNNISEIRISNSVTEIPDYAFSKSNIKSIVIGSKVEKINYSAFFGCASLESIVVPISVKHIASYSFYKCDMLQTVFYEGAPEEWERVFIGRNGNTISSARVYYYSPAKPTVGALFWHYVDGVPTPWEN